MFRFTTATGEHKKKKYEVQLHHRNWKSSTMPMVYMNIFSKKGNTVVDTGREAAWEKNAVCLRLNAQVQRLNIIMFIIMLIIIIISSSMIYYYLFFI